MKRTLILLFIGSALGYLVTPQIADGLPPCHCRGDCGWSCEPDPFGIGMWECRQMYDKAVRSKTGEGIEHSSSCGMIFTGEQCDTFAWTGCGGAAYTTGACDP
jgi:hypothetical protein